MRDDNGGFFGGPFEHFDATPEAIEGSATELDRAYGNVEVLSSDVAAAHRPSLTGVSGVLAGPLASAPQPVRANTQQVMAAAMVAAGSVRVFGHAVQEYDTGVDGLNARWRAAIASDFWVAPASYPTDASAVQQTRVDEARSDAVLDAKIALLKELEVQYQDLRVKLDAAADRSAARLNEGPTDENILRLFAAGGLPSTIVGAFPHLRFTMKQLPPDLAEMSDDELADYALAHPELGAGLLPLLDEQVKQLIGEQLAERGKGLGNEFDERQAGFRTEIDSFAAALAAYGTDAVVATSFLNTIGPRGLLELNGRVATALYDLPDGYQGTHPDGATGDTQYPRLAASIAAFQKALGVTLAAGISGQPTTYDWSGEGTSTYVSGDWSNQLLTESEKEIGLLGVERDTEVDEVYGYQLLAPLLANGDHSPGFLYTVGGYMLDFEQNYADEHGGMLPWDQRPGGAEELEGLRLDWTLGSADGTTAGWDPITGLMRGLANDPEASRGFFMGEVTGGDQPRFPRLDYLLTDREWMVDTPWPVEGAGPEVNGIATLGDALKTATMEDPDSRSISLVEAIVHEVAIDEEASGYENGDYGHEGDRAARFSDAELIDPELRGSLGEIASQYVGSFSLSLSPSESSGAQTTDYLFDDAAFNDLEAKRFLADLGKDPAAAGSITAASKAYAVHDLQRQLAFADEDRYEGIVNNVTSSSAAVIGAVDFGAIAAIKHGIQFDDQEFNDGVDRGLQLAGTMKGLITGLPPVVSAGVSNVLADLGDSLHQDHIGEANAQTGEYLEKSADQQQDFYRLAVWQLIPADQLPAGFEPGIDPQAQIDKDPTLADAYERWKLTSRSSYAGLLADLDVKDAYMNKVTQTRTSLENW